MAEYYARERTDEPRRENGAGQAHVADQEVLEAPRELDARPGGVALLFGAARSTPHAAQMMPITTQRVFALQRSFGNSYIQQLARRERVAAEGPQAERAPQATVAAETETAGNGTIAAPSRPLAPGAANDAARPRALAGNGRLPDVHQIDTARDSTADRSMPDRETDSGARGSEAAAPALTLERRRRDEPATVEDTREAEDTVTPQEKQAEPVPAGGPPEGGGGTAGAAGEGGGGEAGGETPSDGAGGADATPPVTPTPPGGGADAGAAGAPAGADGGAAVAAGAVTAPRSPEEAPAFRAVAGRASQTAQQQEAHPRTIGNHAVAQPLASDSYLSSARKPRSSNSPYVLRQLTAVQRQEQAEGLAPETEEEARAEFELGREAHEAGNYEEALRHFEAAAAAPGLDPSRLPALLRTMAHVRARLGDVDGAMTDAMTYGQYSQDPPQSRLIEEIERIAAESSGQQQEAPAVAETDEEARAEFELAREAREAGNYEEALRHYEAAAAAPGLDPSRLPYLIWNMADVRARLGDVDGAMTDAMTYGQYSQDPPQSRLIEKIERIAAESPGQPQEAPAVAETDEEARARV